jgi:plasmid maintenance system antidote protein VapI
MSTTTAKTTAAAKSTAKRTTTKATPAKATGKKATPTKAAAAKVTEPKPKAEPKPATSAAPEGHPGHTWLAILGETGLSQTQAATAMQVAPMTLNRLINGKGIPTANVTIRFAMATKKPVKPLWDEVAAWELAQAQVAFDAETKSA